MTLFDRRFRNLLYSREVKDKLNHIGDAEEFYFSQLRSSPNQSLISKVNYFDLTSYLPDCMLVKVDVASMANSLEIRNPFLDHKLVEFVVALPDEFKLNGGIGKYILRKMARNLLPEIIIERPKMGFAPPVDLWFRRELKDLACECLINNPISRMFFNEKITRQIVLQHLTGRHDRGRLIWLLVNFVIWYRTFMENR
jgi:asparagine synthase (glutamine-hydrolysing)